MNIRYIFVLSLLLLTACGPYAEYVNSTYHDVELVGVDPPKRMYVDIRIVETGDVYNRIYVSKRCSTWRNNAVIGKIFRVRLDHYRTVHEGNVVQNSQRWNSDSFRAELCK